MISDATIQALKSRLDIVDVISGSIELKKAGSNFKGLCPFHDEKTPSFVVTPAKQFYHCFSCGASGDAIKFVQEYEKLTYPEAIDKLAARYSISVERTNEKAQTSDILAKMTDYFKKQLELNTQAREYLFSRGLHTSTIENFEIGWSPNAQTQLNYMRSNHLSMPDALRFGVISDEQGSIYPRFHERIMFPIRSHTGSLVGFGGRTISGHPAKYINSPQTEIFHKSKLFYGYTLAKETIHKKKEIIVVEGYLDVLMLHQAGFSNAVAVLGTALTVEHLPLLRRGEPKVILAFDGDKAGLKAALKSAVLLAVNAFEGGIAVFANGADPAQLIAEGKTAEAAQNLRSVIPFGKFAVEATIEQFALNDPSQRQKALDDVSDMLKQFPPALQEEYAHLAAAILRIQPKQILAAQPKQQNSQQTQTGYGYGVTELCIIKTLMENPELIDTALNRISSNMLSRHADLFDLAVKGEKEHPKLLELGINESIKTLDADELERSLGVFAVRYYENALQLIKQDSSTNLEGKMFQLRKYQNILAKLKKGESVTIA